MSVHFAAVTFDMAVEYSGYGSAHTHANAWPVSNGALEGPARQGTRISSYLNLIYALIYIYVGLHLFGFNIKIF